MIGRNKGMSVVSSDTLLVSCLHGLALRTCSYHRPGDLRVRSPMSRGERTFKDHRIATIRDSTLAVSFRKLVTAGRSLTQALLLRSHLVKKKQSLSCPPEYSRCSILSALVRSNYACCADAKAAPDTAVFSFEGMMES